MRLYYKREALTRTRDNDLMQSLKEIYEQNLILHNIPGAKLQKINEISLHII